LLFSHFLLAVLPPISSKDNSAGCGDHKRSSVADRQFPRRKALAKASGFTKAVAPLLTETGLQTEVAEDKRLNPV